MGGNLDHQKPPARGHFALGAHIWFCYAATGAIIGPIGPGLAAGTKQPAAYRLYAGIGAQCA